MTPDILLGSIVFIFGGAILFWRLYNKKPVNTPEPVPPVPQETPEPHVSRVTEWALAHQAFEGGKPTDPNMLRNNPGNCKKVNPDGTTSFITFKTYQDGFDYLCKYIIRACTDLHPAYIAKAKKLGLKSSGDLNLLQYIQVYTAGDSTLIQTNYSNFIARALKVFPSVAIKTLL